MRSTQSMAMLKLPVDRKRDHMRGPADAPVTLVEYGDFECPHCGQAHYIVNEIEELLSDSLSFVFRNFPLNTVHPHAQMAAEAAEAAGAQRMFWEMHDTLFENQHALDEVHLVQYAEILGLDLQKFVRDLEEGRFAPKVREDFLSGVHSGVNGTPTFFVNGVRHDGGYDLNSLLAGINLAVEGVVPE
jgi:protein-disulfide isomerase